MMKTLFYKTDKQQEFLRFLLSGGFNFVVTYILYLILIEIIPYKISYSISFIVGVVLAYYLNCKFVFRSKKQLSTFALFPLVYLIQYVLGLVVISLWVQLFGFNKAFAPIAAIIITIPITFILSRKVLTKNL